MRGFLPHPDDIPVQLTLRQSPSLFRQRLHTISLGGVACNHPRAYRRGMAVEMLLPSLGEQARYPGYVAWCQRQDDGYRVGRAWVALQVAAGRQVIGHKIGLTSRAMQMASQIDEPDFGTLLQSMLFTAPAGQVLEIELEPVDAQHPRITITAYWHPAGVWGLSYWYALVPAHLFIFDGMCKEIAKRATQRARAEAAPEGQPHRGAAGINGAASGTGKAYEFTDHTFDVVVVGAGVAALSAALELGDESEIRMAFGSCFFSKVNQRISITGLGVQRRWIGFK